MGLECWRAPRLIHSTFVNCFQWAGPCAKPGVYWRGQCKWLLSPWLQVVAWKSASYLGKILWENFFENQWFWLLTTYFPNSQNALQGFKWDIMHLVWGRAMKGEIYFSACCLINIYTATSHQCLSFQSELGLVGSTSRGRVLFLAGHLNF